MVNWGKFLLGELDHELSYRSVISDSGQPLMREIGWGRGCLWVLDLQTGEGAYFRIGGHAGYDLKRHRIWVCPMFEPFLEWLYAQPTVDLDTLPAKVELPHAESALYGYRRQGP